LWSSEAGMVAFSSYSNCFGGWLLIDGSWINPIDR
jgi:hypothetical protein